MLTFTGFQEGKSHRIVLLLCCHMTHTITHCLFSLKTAFSFSLQCFLSCNTVRVTAYHSSADFYKLVILKFEYPSISFIHWNNEHYPPKIMFHLKFKNPFFVYFLSVLPPGHTGRFIKTVFCTSLLFVLAHICFQTVLYTYPPLNIAIGDNCSQWDTITRHIGLSRYVSVFLMLHQSYLSFSLMFIDWW